MDGKGKKNRKEKEIKKERNTGTREKERKKEENERTNEKER
jgi:hypothetical protein